MSQSVLGKIILSPLTAVYGLMISIRNVLYETELIKSTKFSLPIICIGNLSVGGAGKTPHIEYLTKLLTPYINVGILSRGYKRKTQGFRWVVATDDVLQSGDEPLMYARKYRDIVVAVGENRAIAIPQMVAKYPSLQTILLDDAFQHRSITAGLNILLTTHDEPYTDDYLMPSGRLREYRSGADRADIVVVTKCPPQLSEAKASTIASDLQLKSFQKLFYSYYKYGYPYSFYDGKKRIKLDDKLDVILISAIANTSYLLAYLEEEVATIHHMDYADHHLFSERDVEYINTVYTNRDTERRIVLTTEKDAMRLDLHRQYLSEHKIPIFVLPAEVSFHFGGEKEFEKLTKDYLLNFKI